MGLPALTISGLTLLPVDCFSRIARQPGSIWLDSSLTRNNWGLTSLLATDPIGELTLSNGKGTISYRDGETKLCDRNSLLAELEQIRTTRDRYAIGFVSYEATLPWLRLEPKSDIAELPEIHFYVYDRILSYDHLSGEFSDAELAVQLLNRYDNGITPNITPTETTLQPVVPEQQYLQKIERVKHHIREGDIYQANFTSRFDGYSNLDPYTAYLRLRRFNPAPYSAFMNFGNYQVLSSSPERMFQWTGNRITSSPIKGTIERGVDPKSDEENRRRLLNSAKDRAELLMIVDLVRNDLGRIATTGSVAVDQLFRVDNYSSLIHLVADISAKVRPGVTLSNMFEALLPGGSITGAPKRRAVEMLSELEETPRSVYTGSIGVVGNGKADFNIAIRTITHRSGSYRIHAGGGIVADSDPAAEYREMLLKAQNLFRAIGARE